jgi:polar amino acid transport system substrate-binding protein
VISPLEASKSSYPASWAAFDELKRHTQQGDDAMSRRTPSLTLLLAAVIVTAWVGAKPSLFVAGQAQPPMYPHGPEGALQAHGLFGSERETQEDLLNQVLAAGKLVVATDANYPPWSFINDQAQLDGFDVDVAKEVAAHLGVQIEFVTPSWEDVTAGDWGAAWDVSIGSMTPTDERAEVLWFTQPYYYVKGVFAIHRDNTTFQDVGDLAGHTVGVGTASLYEAYLLGYPLNLGTYGGFESYPPPQGVTVRAYSTDAEAIQDLGLGDGVRLDAVMSAQPTVHNAIDLGLPLKLLGEPAFGEPIVFALDQARGPSDLMIARLNEIIEDMRGDDTLSSISLKWLGFDLTTAGEPWNPPYSSFLPLVAR